MSRPSLLSRALLVIVAALVLAVPAGAQEAEPAPPPLPENPHERLAEVRRRQAEAALEVDTLSASAAEVQARLADVEAWVAAQEKVVASAQAALVESTLAAEEARDAEEAKARELEQLEQLMADVAVEAFMQPRQMASLSVMVSQDLDAAAKADVMLRARADRDQAIAEELAEAEAELSRLRVLADEEAERAEAVAEEAATALDELHRARLEQVAMAERIKAELASTADRIQLLEGAEFEAAVAVARETEALLARVARDGGVPLVDAAGFRVHADIGPAVEALVEHAARDGIVLKGWGARTTEQQIDLRRKHCGGSDVSDAQAVFEVPPASCSPPTAKPGTSMHELGLAIDFTHDGASISTRQSPAFAWLAEHAGDYGFKNLPSEPWHWSVNGK